MVWAPCAHRQEVETVLYSIWYHHTCRSQSGAQDCTAKTKRWSKSCPCDCQAIKTYEVVEVWDPRVLNRTPDDINTEFILVINQLDAQNLFYNKFISCLYMFRAPCAHRQEVKVVLYSIWHHHTETIEWSKITKYKICSYLYILVILVILDHSIVSVWWYQMLYNTILTSWRWAHGARNM